MSSPNVLESEDVMCECGDYRSEHVDGNEQCVISGCGCKEYFERFREEEML